jgi:hypothetical protein
LSHWYLSLAVFWTLANAASDWLVGVDVGGGDVGGVEIGSGAGSRGTKTINFERSWRRP